MARKNTKPITFDGKTRVVVLHGKESLLRSEYTALLKAALEEAHAEVDVIHFDGETAQVADVLDECRSFGLMQQHKLVIVDEADQFVKEDSRPLIERYAQQPAEIATLVLRAQRWNKGKLDKLIEKVGLIVKCDTVTPGQAMSWAIKRCEKRHQTTIDRDAAALLVEKIGADLGRVDTELAKLASGTAPGEPITIGAVVELVGTSREDEIWGIQSTLLTNDPEAILGAIRDALEVSRHSPVLVSFACIDLAKKLHGASRGLRAGMNTWDLAKTLRIWGPSKDSILAAARRIEPDTASELLKAAVEADMAQKSGLGRPERALEMLAVKFASVSA